MKIVITGAGGFIGHALAEYLKKSADGNEILCPKRAELDLLDTDSVEDYLNGVRPDVVIHSAIQRTFGMPESVKHDVLPNNLTMFCNLERCSEYYGKLICIGSGAEYDKRAYIPLMKEEYFSQSVPRDMYGLSKYVISKIAAQHENIYILRAFGVFGPHEDYNNRFISNAVCNALLRRDIVIRQNVRFDYLYIDDFCEMIRRFLLLKAPDHRVYNACRGEAVEILKIAEIIKKAVGGSGNITVKRDGLGAEYSGDNSRLLSEIGRIDFISFEDAVERLISYYRSIDFKLEDSY